MIAQLDEYGTPKRKCYYRVTDSIGPYDNLSRGTFP